MNRARFAGLMAAAMMLLAACGVYVPEGATVVVVKNSKQEFDRAELRPRNELNRGEIYRMRWYDDNTFMTTVSLAPGIYNFAARSYLGGGLDRQIEVVPGKNLYEVEAGSRTDADSSVSQGAPLSGKITFAPGQPRSASVSILFIGPSIEMRSAAINPDGTFQSNFPHNNTWRVELHIPGTPPRSYVHPLVKVQGPVDLGTVQLK